MVNPTNPALADASDPRAPASAKAGRRVLVTGGAHRFGAEICRQFARAGWDVLVHYHQSGLAAEQLAEQLHQQFGIQATAWGCDLSDSQSRAAMLQAMGSQHGVIDALVNNASMFSPDKGDEVDEALAQAHLQVNLMVPLALAREVTLLARAQANKAEGDPPAVPCILHVLDQKVFNLNPDYFSYTLSKLALERAVALQAQALAPFARVCGVAPGLMYLSGDQTQENFDMAARANLLRKPIDPANVARGCVFLAENDGVTGTTLSVDNGQHLVPSPKDIMFVVDELLAPRRALGPQNPELQDTMP